MNDITLGRPSRGSNDALCIRRTFLWNVLLAFTLSSCSLFLYIYTEEKSAEGLTGKGLTGNGAGNGQDNESTMHIPDPFFLPSILTRFWTQLQFRKVLRGTAISTHTRGRPNPFTARGIKDDEVLTSISWLCIGCGREVLHLRGTRTLTVTRLIRWPSC